MGNSTSSHRYVLSIDSDDHNETYSCSSSQSSEIVAWFSSAYICLFLPLVLSSMQERLLASRRVQHGAASAHYCCSMLHEATTRAAAASGYYYSRCTGIIK